MQVRSSWAVLLFSIAVSACSSPDGAGGANDSAVPEGGAAQAEGGAPDAVETTDTGMPADAGASTDAADGAAPSDATVDGGLQTDATSDGQTVSDAATDAAQPPDGGAGPSNEIAYVATYLSGLAAFAVQADGGALVEVDGSPYAHGAALYAATLDPSGQFIYAVDVNSDEILGFRVAPGGQLTPLQGFPVSTGVGPVSIAIDPLRRFAYVGTADPNASLYTYAMNPDDGRLTPTGAPPYVLHSSADYIAAAPSGLFVYICVASGIHAYAVDGDSGALSELGTSPFATGVVFRGSLVFHPGGRLLFAGGNGLNVFTVDPVTGVLGAVNGSPFTTDVGSDPMSTDLALDPTGRFVYAVHGTGDLSAFSIADSGALVAVDGSPYDAGTLPYSVAVDPAGHFVLVGNDDVNELSVFTIDPGSGELAPAPHSPSTVVGLQPEIVVAPR